MSKVLHKAFHLRQETDYKEFIIITREETLEIKKQTENFLNKIKAYLKAEEKKGF